MLCLHCNASFTGKRTDAKYCSISCRQKAYAVRHPEQRKERHLKSRDKNLAKMKQWYETHKEHHMQLTYKWKKDNSWKVNANTAKRYAAKRQATPVWADRNKIFDIYKEAKEKNMQVDHIIPLRSEKVCGLHWEDNLQLLSPLENQIKSNKLMAAA